MLTSLHNHTTWSDGEPTIAQMVAEAERLGVDEVGISDHYALTPDNHRVEWSMPLPKLGEYVAELQKAKALARRTTVRLGVEADFFPETVEELDRRLRAYPFDYVIGSVHFLDDFKIDTSEKDWEALSPDQVNEKWALYWQRIKQMAESGTFDVAAHIDLPKKFGFRPTADVSSEEAAALDAVAKAGMSIEINTAGWYKPCKEAYPTEHILEEARTRRIPLMINADAHSVLHLTRDFDGARAMARRARYTELVSYMGREQIVNAL